MEDDDDDDDDDDDAGGGDDDDDDDDAGGGDDDDDDDDGAGGGGDDDDDDGDVVAHVAGLTHLTPGSAIYLTLHTQKEQRNITILYTLSTTTPKKTTKTVLTALVVHLFKKKKSFPANVPQGQTNSHPRDQCSSLFPTCRPSTPTT